MQDTSAVFETANHTLETFLYWHKIRFSSTYKSKHDGMTVWVYRKTDRLSAVVDEFNEIYG